MSINAEFPTSHRLDLVHFLLGDVARARTTAARGSGYYFELLGETFELETTSGVTVRLSSHWTESGMPEAIYLVGEGAAPASMYLSDLKRGEIVIHQNPELPEKHYRVEHPGGLPYTHTGLIENFVDHLRSGAPLLCDGEQGRKSTVVLDVLGEIEAGVDFSPVSY